MEMMQSEFYKKYYTDFWKGIEIGNPLIIPLTS
ncbi:hypothetical protein ACVWYG_000172 [Pedobacter sp. UYEF25]